MGLEEIKSEILKDAEQESDEIVEEAKQQKKEILNEAEEEAEEIREQIEEELEEEKESYRKKALSNARMKAKQEKMKAKQEKIDEVFDEFRDHLGDLSKTDREQFAERCLEKVDFEVARVEGSSEFEGAFDAEFEETDINGIRVFNEDGSRRQSFTFDKIVQQYRDRFRREVADILF